MDETWYKLYRPEIGFTFQNFYKTCKELNSLDKRSKKLLMLALACVMNCPRCTEAQIKKALIAGGGNPEVADVLMLAAGQGAGTQLFWCRKKGRKRSSITRDKVSQNTRPPRGCS